jgi:eukaryotic translation initiation factor 2-alpha kinase 4
MAPKSALNKKKNPAFKSQANAQNDGIPHASTTDYAQQQDEELEALQAIYMDDYGEIETKGAWSKTTDKAFKLTLRAFSDANVFVVILVKFTATYPKTLPILTLERVSNVRAKTQRALKQLLATKAKELLGEVMIYEIAVSIQERLEDEAQNKASDLALPTLEEERAMHEAAASTLARQLEDEKQKKEAEAKAEEERVLKQMMEDEVNRRKEQKPRKPRNPINPAITPPPPPDADDYLAFDRPISIQPQGGASAVTFTAVRHIEWLAEGPVTQVSTAKPIVDMEPVEKKPKFNPTIVVKRFQQNNANNASIKQAFLALEEELEKLRALPSHQNVVQILDFRVDVGDICQVNVLTQHANRGSLKNELLAYSVLPVDRVRAWTVELLEALDHYHRNGVVHMRIHANNILLSQASNGLLSVKLADASFQQGLHDLKNQSKTVNGTHLSARSVYWTAPELSEDSSKKSSKTDVWELGLVFLEMLFGSNVTQKHSSCNSLMDSLDLSAPLEEIVRKFFKSDPRKRPTAFDLIPCEFLRHDVPLYSRPSSPVVPRLSSSLSLPARDRRRGSNAFGLFSRYASEWDEVGRLGKGGYGEVVKARNKVEGRIYAIKKIRQNSSAALTEVLSEVMLLSRLNHPYVVRYYGAWAEDDFSSNATESSESNTITESEQESSQVLGQPSLSLGFGQDTNDFGHSTAGLDFISSSGFPKVEFGEDSDEDSGDEESEDDFAVAESDSGPAIQFERPTDSAEPSNKLRLKRTSSSTRPRPIKSTLYIQMEYCERHTLRDLIRKDLDQDVDEGWRLFRQILEGLAHIHSHGIIHRDLKPDNIFLDVANNPKIGDFGLATRGQAYLAGRVGNSTLDGGDMTRSVGTTFYVAPELRSNVSGSYNEKVDMYSLGIIFFEMCYPLKTAMERDQEIRKIREKEHSLPSSFQSNERALQGSIILSLISHKPSERPTSSELLRSGKIPVLVEDEGFKRALEVFADPDSQYYHKYLSALFSQPSGARIKDDLWITSSAVSADLQTMALRTLVRDRLAAIFKKHGAVQTDRPPLIPRSKYYANSNAVQLLHSSGMHVQLPYDLILPNAQIIARREPLAVKSYTFGEVYRDAFSGGAPRPNKEADFDIVSHDTLDLALKEAEVIEVLDEIIDEFPCFSSTPMCFHLNHSDLLELILEYCRISAPQRPAVKEVLSKLNIHDWTWSKVKNELRSPTLGIASTALDDIARFDFRETPDKAFMKIRNLFECTDYLPRIQPIFRHMESVITYLKAFHVRRKIFVSPLSSFNEKFYSGGMLFQCLFDKKSRDVLAAGGRYDRLIKEQALIPSQSTGCRAVGFNLGWDRIVSSMARFIRNQGKSTSFFKKQAHVDEEQRAAWTPRRCDVLVASFDPSVLRSTGLRLVKDLWSNDFSAELAIDARSPEELASFYRDDRHSWFVIIKHDSSGPGGSIKADLKVKSFVTKVDTDVKSENLVPLLRAEIRDREHREGIAERRAILQRQPSGPDYGGSAQRKSDVQVLVAQHRSKKTSKWNIVETAQSRGQELLSDYSSAPTAAIETTDSIFDMIRTTRLGDTESWRRVVQGVPLGDREYIGQVQDLLEQFRRKWRTGAEEGGDACRMAFLYNFRTGAIALYDLGL